MTRNGYSIEQRKWCRIMIRGECDSKDSEDSGRSADMARTCDITVLETVRSFIMDVASHVMTLQESSRRGRG